MGQRQASHPKCVVVILVALVFSRSWAPTFCQEVGGVSLTDNQPGTCDIPIDLELTLGFYVGCFWLLSALPLKLNAAIANGELAGEFAKFLAPLLAIVLFLILGLRETPTTFALIVSTAYLFLFLAGTVGVLAILGSIVWKLLGQRLFHNCWPRLVRFTNAVVKAVTRKGR